MVRGTARVMRAAVREVASFLRRQADYARVRAAWALGRGGGGRLRLHLGCGDRRLPGFVNIDRRWTAASDVVASVERLPYPPGAAEVIETYHLLEHLPRHAVPAALREWHRVLAPGGRLVIECPDFDAAVGEYLTGREERLDSIFGLQRYAGDAHLFGYNFERLRRLLAEAGFASIERRPAQDYHAAQEPCLRVECVKA